MLTMLRALLLVLAIIGGSSSALALDRSLARTAAGLTVYLGVVPAEIVRGHPPSHAEAKAHGGAPGGARSFHFVVAIFDATTGARISDAKVTARVSSLGLAGPRKNMEPMKIADTITYGNYFDLPGKGQYRVDVEVERPHGTDKFEFVYEQ